MRISHRALTRLIVGALLALAVLLPLIVGVTFGTGEVFQAIPFSAVAIVLGIAAHFVFRLRSPVDNPPTVDATRLLVEEMYDRVLEESFLFELSLPSTTVLSRRRTIVNGPFPLESCSAVLIHWFDSGWLDLLTASHPESWLEGLPSKGWEGRLVARADADYAALAEDDARLLLIDPTRWAKETRDGLVMLGTSAAGSQVPWQQWIQVGEAVSPI